MNDNVIGEFFKEQRIRMGLTQEYMAELLMSDRQTISKIELGKQMPRRDTMALFCEKCGIIGGQYYDVERFVGIEIEEFKEQIKKANACHNYAEAIRLRQCLEKKHGCKSEIMKQFFLWTDAINGRLIDGKIVAYSFEERRAMMIEAIKLTIPGFNTDQIGNSLLGLNEATIVLNIANTYLETNNYNEAIYIYKQLLSYVDKHFLDLSESCQIIPLLTYNYSRALGHVGINDEELRIAEIGIENCRKFRKEGMLGELLINKSFALKKLGRTDEAKSTAIRSYYVLDAIGATNNAENVLCHLKETYKWEPYD